MYILKVNRHLKGNIAKKNTRKKNTFNFNRLHLRPRAMLAFKAQYFIYLFQNSISMFF